MNDSFESKDNFVKDLSPGSIESQINKVIEAHIINSSISSFERDLDRINNQEMIESMNFHMRDQMDMLQQQIGYQQNQMMFMANMFQQQTAGLLTAIKGLVANSYIQTLQLNPNSQNQDIGIESDLSPTEPLYIEAPIDDEQDIEFEVVNDAHDVLDYDDNAPVLTESNDSDKHKMVHYRRNFMTKDSDQSATITGPTPLVEGGWIPVLYAEKSCLVSEQYVDAGVGDNVDIKNAVTKDEEVMSCKLLSKTELNVYKHKLPNGFVNTTPDGTLYWDAFDIDFDPQWKSVIAECSNGLSNSKFAVIRLLVNKPDLCTDFISVYVNDVVFSQYFRKAHEDNPNKPVAPIVYSGSLKEDKNYIHVISVLSYAWQLNHGRPFVIIEQIADHRFGGEKSLMLTNLEPKTEITAQYNIFKCKPEQKKVYTNYRMQSFMCMKTEDGGYSITRRH